MNDEQPPEQPTEGVATATVADENTTPGQQSEPASAAGDDSADSNPNQEAARYRVKLREVERERDDLASVAMRATWCIGHAVVRPDRIGVFTITAPGS